MDAEEKLYYFENCKYCEPANLPNGGLIAMCTLSKLPCYETEACNYQEREGEEEIYADK